jgi:hypothetical protein
MQLMLRRRQHNSEVVKSRRTRLNDPVTEVAILWSARVESRIRVVQVDIVSRLRLRPKGLAKVPGPGRQVVPLVVFDW